jgi:hypothetical protein
MKNILYSLIALVASYNGFAQTLPKTTVSPNIPNYNSNSIFKEVNGDFLYVSDSVVFSGTNFTYNIEVMKLNPTTNKLEHFFFIPNKKGFFTSDIEYNAQAGKYVISTFDPNFKGFYYAGTPTTMTLIDSLHIGDPNTGYYLITSHMVGNKHYLRSKDSIFSMAYTPNSISFVHAATGNKSINYVVASENDLIFQEYTNAIADVYELFKLNNGAPISIDTAATNNLAIRNFLKVGTDLYMPFKNKTLKVDASNQITVLNFTVSNIIAKLGSKLIGTLDASLKAFDLSSQTESILSNTILNEYYVLNKVAFSNNVCYIEGSYSSENLVVVTDGTVAGTKSKRLKSYLGTRADAWAMCGDNLIFDYQDNDVAYEVAILKPDTTLIIYDEKPGGINGISPRAAYNANGSAYLIFTGTAGIELARIDACNSPTALNDVFSKNMVQVYPNPANDFININSKIGIASVKVMDITGKIVLQQNNTKYHNELHISTKNLNGNYWVQIFDERGANLVVQIAVNY